MSIKGTKIRAKNQQERKVILDCFKNLGLNIFYNFPACDDFFFVKSNGDVHSCENAINSDSYDWITIEKLKDEVVLHVNSPQDANYSMAVASDRPDYPVFKSSEGVFHTYSDNNNKWVECNSINDKTTGLKALPERQPVVEAETTTIKVKGLENLIEGPVALQAALDGQLVQFSVEPWEEKQWDTYNPQEDEISAKVFFTGMSVDMRKVFFRIKPKTISINGIELPAPNFHKPNDGCSVWWLDDSARFKRGYHGSENFIGDDDDSWAFGWWDSEKKIEQVVAALRKVFEVQP